MSIDWTHCLDLIGTELCEEERELLQHPSVGGVILFTRNYETPTQLKKIMSRDKSCARS